MDFDEMVADYAKKIPLAIGTVGRGYRKICPMTGKWWSQPLIKPTSLDIAWAAGIFEGEGHVRATKGSVRTDITQNDRWLLDVIRDRFGGSVYTRHTRCCSLIIEGVHSRAFLMTIYMFLSPRRKRQVKDAFVKGKVLKDAID